VQIDAGRRGQILQLLFQGQGHHPADSFATRCQCGNSLAHAVGGRKRAAGEAEAGEKGDESHAARTSPFSPAFLPSPYFAARSRT
jgi:hypothetical protein